MFRIFPSSPWSFFLPLVASTHLSSAGGGPALCFSWLTYEIYFLCEFIEMARWQVFPACLSHSFIHSFSADLVTLLFLQDQQGEQGHEKTVSEWMNEMNESAVKVPKELLSECSMPQNHWALCTPWSRICFHLCKHLLIQPHMLLPHIYLKEEGINTTHTPKRIHTLHEQLLQNYPPQHKVKGIDSF